MAVRVSNAEKNKLLSSAFKSNGLVFTSGSTGADPQTGEIPESLEEQTHNAIKDLKKTLELSGSSLDKTLKVLLFISDGAHAKTVNEIYGLYFTNRPARSCIIVQFPNLKLKVELECVAEYERDTKL